MAFKLNGTSPDVTKQYLYPILEAGQVRMFEYVSADAATTVDGSAYISNSTADGQVACDMLRIGDYVWAIQVGSIDDTRSVAKDKQVGGITDVSLHMVLDNTGSVVDLSDDILGATVTYGD